jgi:hypothetical protein
MDRKRRTSDDFFTSFFSETIKILKGNIIITGKKIPVNMFHFTF